MKNDWKRILKIICVIGVVFLLFNPALWIGGFGMLLWVGFVYFILTITSRLLFGVGFFKLIFGKEEK